MSERKTVSTPMERWQWFGDTAHFICGHDCLHHLATRVGNYMVSTVGNYRPRHKWTLPGPVMPDAEEVGYNRKYETYVFRITNGNGCDCGCGLPSIDLSEIDSLSANDGVTSNRNHVAMCRKYARRK